MEPTAMIKKVFNTKPEGTRKVGRPRLRWEYCVWQDIRILGVRNCKGVASNGEEWRTILRKARAHTGLSCQCCCCCCCCCCCWFFFFFFVDVDDDDDDDEEEEEEEEEEPTAHVFSIVISII
jgi:hypothetical protein